MRFVLIISILFIHYSSYAGLLGEAESAQVYDHLTGVAIGTSIVESILNEDFNDIDFEDVVKISTQNSKLYNESYSEGQSILNFSSDLESVVSSGMNLRNALGLIKKTTNLLTTLCALGTDGCTAALTHQNSLELRNVNVTLGAILKNQFLEREMRKRKDLDLAEKNLESIEIINKAPGKFSKYVKSFFKGLII